MLRPKTLQNHGIKVLCLVNFSNPSYSSGQLWYTVVEKTNQPLALIWCKMAFFQLGPSFPSNYVRSSIANNAQYLTKGKLIIVWKKFFFWFYGRFQKFRSFHEEKSYFWQKFEAIRTFLGGLRLAILPYFCHF